MSTLIAKLLNTVDWHPIEPEPFATDLGLSYATHLGVLKAEGFELHCYKLSDGQIFFDAVELEGFLRGCVHNLTSGPCPICHPLDDSLTASRLMVILRN